MSHATNFKPPNKKRQKDDKTTSQVSNLQVSHLTKSGKRKKRQKDEKTTSQVLQMSHMTKFIPPRKRKKRQKDEKNDISRPPNEQSDQIHTLQKKKKKRRKMTSQDLKMSHMTEFIPSRKKEDKKTKKRHLKTSK